MTSTFIHRASSPLLAFVWTLSKSAQSALKLSLSGSLSTIFKRGGFVTDSVKVVVCWGCLLCVQWPLLLLCVRRNTWGCAWLTVAVIIHSLSFSISQAPVGEPWDGSRWCPGGSLGMKEGGWLSIQPSRKLQGSWHWIFVVHLFPGTFCASTHSLGIVPPGLL